MTSASSTQGASSPPPALWRIEHAGAATSVGSSAWQSAASWVGLQKRFRKNVVAGLGEVPVTLAPCPEIAGDWPASPPQNAALSAAAMLAPQRMAHLLAVALADMLTQREGSAAPSTPISASEARPLMAALALPAWISEAQAQSLWHQSLGLLRQQGGGAQAAALSQIPLQILRSGHTASFEALEQLNRAHLGLGDVLLLATDSSMDLALLQPALATNQLLTDKNQDGMVASEAAAALWLRRVPDTTSVDERHLVIHSPALERSAQPHYSATRETPPDALAQVFRSALQHAGWAPEHVGHTLSDSDGSAWRASAEMAAMARTLHGQAPDEWQPATVVGQVGAATGALHWALAAMRMRHDKTVPNALLSWTLDKGELAAAVALERTIYNEATLAAMAQKSRMQRSNLTETLKTFSARLLNQTP